MTIACQAAPKWDAHMNYWVVPGKRIFKDGSKIFTDKSIQVKATSIKNGATKAENFAQTHRPVGQKDLVLKSRCYWAVAKPALSIARWIESRDWESLRLASAAAASLSELSEAHISITNGPE